MVPEVRRRPCSSEIRGGGNLRIWGWGCLRLRYPTLDACIPCKVFTTESNIGLSCSSLPPFSSKGGVNFQVDCCRCSTFSRASTVLKPKAHEKGPRFRSDTTKNDASAAQTISFQLDNTPNNWSLTVPLKKLGLKTTLTAGAQITGMFK